MCRLYNYKLCISLCMFHRRLCMQYRYYMLYVSYKRYISRFKGLRSVEYPSIKCNSFLTYFWLQDFCLQEGIMSCPDTLSTVAVKSPPWSLLQLSGDSENRGPEKPFALIALPTVIAIGKTHRSPGLSVGPSRQTCC